MDQIDRSLLFADFLKPHSHLWPGESKSRLDSIRHQMRGYLASVNSPGFDTYQDLMILYPKAKVILSIRDNDGAWWKSFSSTLSVLATKRFEWLTYPVPFLRVALTHSPTRCLTDGCVLPERMHLDRISIERTTKTCHQTCRARSCWFTT